MVLSQIGKLILGLGLALVVIGGAMMLAGRMGLPLGRLPGDFVYRGKHAAIYFPLATCIAISVVLTLIFYVISRFR
jgi:hypothetical protein